MNKPAPITPVRFICSTASLWSSNLRSKTSNYSLQIKCIFLCSLAPCWMTSVWILCLLFSYYLVYIHRHTCIDGITYILFTKIQGNKALETGETFPSFHSQEMEELEFILDLLMLGSLRESEVQWLRAWFFEPDCKSELQNMHLSNDPAIPFPREMKFHV